MSDSLRLHGLQPARLLMGFSRQEYWSRLPFPSPGNLPDPGIEPASLMSPALAGGFFTIREAQSESGSCSAMSDSLSPHGLYSPQDSPGQNTGVSSLSLLQGIFPKPGIKPKHCRQILYQLSHNGFPGGSDYRGVGSANQPRWNGQALLPHFL